MDTDRDVYKVGDFLLRSYDGVESNHPYTLDQDGYVLNTGAVDQRLVDKFWKEQGKRMENGLFPVTLVGLSYQSDEPGFLITEFIHTHGIGGAYDRMSGGRRVFFRTTCCGHKGLEDRVWHTENYLDAVAVHEYLSDQIDSAVAGNFPLEDVSYMNSQGRLGLLRDGDICGFKRGTEARAAIDLCPVRIHF